jgi:tRNA-Thr(GGU) m(6)t(6)A37 methyltransferase TsaA
LARESITLIPIGVVRSPFTDRAQAPRQATAAVGTPGRVELYAGRGLEDAVSDLEGWERIWLLTYFHLSEGFRPKVLPPRDSVRRGVLGTRSPHRPNPIGLSCVRLERVEGLVLHVLDVDIVDGTPLLDVKPYVPYADAFPDAASGWLEPTDPRPAWSVRWSEAARQRAAWIDERQGWSLIERVDATLALGPQPHAYRRIRREGDALTLAVKEWRVRFRADAASRTSVVESINSGFRARDLETEGRPESEVHREFARRFA